MPRSRRSREGCLAWSARAWTFRPTPGARRTVDGNLPGRPRAEERAFSTYGSNNRALELPRTHREPRERELKARDKRSVLGWAWSLINPATTLLVYAIVFGTLLQVKPPVAGNGSLQNFALYLFCGLVIWNFFTVVVNGSMGALVGAGGLLRKVYFPPECPVIANGLVALGADRDRSRHPPVPHGHPAGTCRGRSSSCPT